MEIKKIGDYIGFKKNKSKKIKKLQLCIIILDCIWNCLAKIKNKI
jgi:hypothetical protein